MMSWGTVRLIHRANIWVSHYSCHVGVIIYPNLCDAKHSPPTGHMQDTRKIIRKFVWGHTEGQKGVHLVKWLNGLTSNNPGGMVAWD